LLTYDDEHHRIAFADRDVVLERLHGDVVLERSRGRGVGQIIAARGVDRSEAVDASLDRRTVG
jgi:hypothetical protein